MSRSHERDTLHLEQGLFEAPHESQGSGVRAKDAMMSGEEQRPLMKEECTAVFRPPPELLALSVRRRGAAAQQPQPKEPAPVEERDSLAMALAHTSPTDPAPAPTSPAEEELTMVGTIPSALLAQVSGSTAPPPAPDSVASEHSHDASDGPRAASTPALSVTEEDAAVEPDAASVELVPAEADAMEGQRRRDRIFGWAITILLLIATLLVLHHAHLLAQSR